MMMGQAVQKVALRDASDLLEIQRRLRQAAGDQPEAPRILGAGWLYSALGGAALIRQMLGEAVPDRPVYLDANELHSVWVNSAARAELGIDHTTFDPAGGSISRDPATGKADGMLYETAAHQIIRPALANTGTDEDHDSSLEAAFEYYLSSG